MDGGPEKRLTMFVIRLALLEKTASRIGSVGFVWGTAVMLGSFAANLCRTDFCFITLILLFKGSRNFSTSHCSCRHLLWIELPSATACAVLSLIKLLVHPNYEWNMKASLIVFYALALSGASVLLLEKGYWEWEVGRGRLFECGFGGSDSTLVTRYFHYAYSKCIDGSIFDGSKTDMVSFGMDLILGSHDQLTGAGILRNLATSSQYSQDTLHMIGTNSAVMRRLVDMLSWKDVVIRYSASDILLKLASENQHSLRIAGIPGALRSITSLLSNGLDQMGLDILKELARDGDPDVCRKIGNTKGLLRKIVDLIRADETLLRRAPSHIVRVERALEILKMIATVSGAAGKQLRKQVSEIIYTISYLRDILKYGENQPQLQILAIEILVSLARDKVAAERIGGTGGVVKVLFGIFFNDEIPESGSHVRVAAGEALAMLVLESKKMCHMIVKLRQNARLIKALEVPLLRENAARILRSLCAYAGDHFTAKQLNGLTLASPSILEAIMKEENKVQEAMIGAACNIFKLLSPQESNNMFRRAGIGEYDLAHRLLLILKEYKNPSIYVPSIRRYAIELAIWMMRDDTSNVGIFKNLGMESELESVMGTTSELESFTTLLGNYVGVCRYKVAMLSLVETAMELLKQEVFVCEVYQ